MGEEKKGSMVENRKRKFGSLSSIFMHADGVDWLLMTLGFIGSVGDGFSTPLILLITSKLMNNLGQAPSMTSHNFTDSINKVFLSLFLSLHIYIIDMCICLCLIKNKEANWD